MIVPSPGARARFVCLTCSPKGRGEVLRVAGQSRAASRGGDATDGRVHSPRCGMAAAARPCEGAATGLWQDARPDSRGGAGPVLYPCVVNEPDTWSAGVRVAGWLAWRARRLCSQPLIPSHPVHAKPRSRTRAPQPWTSSGAQTRTVRRRGPPSGRRLPQRATAQRGRGNGPVGVGGRCGEGRRRSRTKRSLPLA